MAYFCKRGKKYVGHAKLDFNTSDFDLQLTLSELNLLVCIIKLLVSIHVSTHIIMVPKIFPVLCLHTVTNDKHYTRLSENHTAAWL